MPNILVAVLVLAQASSASIPALDVTAADIQATLENAIANGVTDTPIRTIDAGGHHVGIAIVHRGPAASVVAGTIHPELTEVYTVLEGSGTMVTGGRLIDRRPRGSRSTARRPGTSGPGWTGNGMEGGVTGQVAAWVAEFKLSRSPFAFSLSTSISAAMASGSRLPIRPSCPSSVVPPWQ